MDNEKAGHSCRWSKLYVEGSEVVDGIQQLCKTLCKSPLGSVSAICA